MLARKEEVVLIVAVVVLLLVFLSLSLLLSVLQWYKSIRCQAFRML